MQKPRAGNVDDRAASHLLNATQAGGHTPLYSVVIPHYQQPDLLERCLESLMAQGECAALRGDRRR